MYKVKLKQFDRPQYGKLVKIHEFSTDKPFTLENYKEEWDDYISNYFNEIPDFFDPIRCRQMLDAYFGLTSKEFIIVEKRLLKRKWKEAFDNGWHYEFFTHYLLDKDKDWI